MRPRPPPTTLVNISSSNGWRNTRVTYIMFQVKHDHPEGCVEGYPEGLPVGCP